MYLFEKLDGEYLNIIGNRVKSMRKTNGFNQSELAQKVGVSRKHISDIENGKGTTLLIFVKLLKIFGKAEKLLEIVQDSDISPKQAFERSQK